MPSLEAIVIKDDAEVRADEVLKRLHVQHPRGAEIGIFMGHMSSFLLGKRSDMFLYMIDPWASSENTPQRYKDTGDYHSKMTETEQERCYQIALFNTRFAQDRREIIRDFSVNAAKQVPDHSLDFAFIDADHSYGGCLEDIEVWKEKIKPGGLLCGDDYGNPCNVLFGVDRAVNECGGRYGWPLDFGDRWTWFVRL